MIHLFSIETSWSNLSFRDNDSSLVIDLQEPEQQQAVFEVIEGGRQEALLSSQSPIPEADREDSEPPMEVMEAAKAATSEAAAAAPGGDNGVVFGNGGIVDGDMMEDGLNGGGDDFILKTPSSGGQLDELIKPPAEPVIQKATVDLLYDNEEPKRPEDVVNDLLSGGHDDDGLVIDTKESGLNDDQKEDVGQFEVKDDQFEVKNDQSEVKNDQFEVTNNQFEVKNDQFEITNSQFEVTKVGDDPFNIGNQTSDVKEVPFEVKDDLSEVKDVPFEVKDELSEVKDVPCEVKEEHSEVKADPFEMTTEVDIAHKEDRHDLMEDKIDPLADFSAPTEVKQG